MKSKSIWKRPVWDPMACRVNSILSGSNLPHFRPEQDRENDETGRFRPMNHANGQLKQFQHWFPSTALVGHWTEKRITDRIRFFCWRHVKTGEEIEEAEIGKMLPSRSWSCHLVISDHCWPRPTLLPTSIEYEFIQFGHFFYKSMIWKIIKIMSNSIKFDNICKWPVKTPSVEMAPFFRTHGTYL